MAIAHPRNWQRLLQKRLAEQTRLNWRWLFVQIFSDATARAKRFDIASDSRALSFTFILSLVPLLAIAFTFFKLFGGLNYFLENSLKPLLEKNFPETVASQLKAFIDGFVGNLQTGTLGVVSFVTLLGTVIVLMMNIEQSFNRIFEARDRRSIMKRIGSYWIMLSATPLVIVLSSAKSSELLLAFNSSNGIFRQFGVVDFLRFVVGHLVQIIGFGSLFIVLPERKPRLLSAFWGALITHLIFQLLASVNVHYATFVFSNRTNLHLYGSLPLLVLVFLIWVRLVWVGILYGACICVAVERYLNTLKSADNKKPWQAPHDTILNCVRTLEHYIDAFNQQKRPISHADVAALLEISGPLKSTIKARLARNQVTADVSYQLPKVGVA
ncbi:YihY/virulence factor BrkB family protein, partial [bacterium]|nr:YihY/virulence factor BrkB family protein [bacterium]